MNPKAILLLFLCLALINISSFAQTIPSHAIILPEKLGNYLNEQARKELEGSKNQSLASYFREKFSKRFFYPYQSFADRLAHYNQTFKNQRGHQARALDHLAKFPDSAQWKLPFNYRNGQPVNAYALRHLARQHKMVDIAFHYYNDQKDAKLIQYFENQMRSLNAALHVGEYEKIEDGNGVYEAFRAGYRVLNWLWIHNMFLNEEEYSDEDQLITIATLLQHGQHLYERNDRFRSGNHQTRGVSALAMLAILLRDFVGTDQWLERAMLRLSEHLDKEINPDGFQFERSVHYHMSDINNYFYVYQLAKINGIPVDKAWEDKLRGLFTTLVKVAYPDRSAPVLQDDTDIPWAETNDISGAMTLGYLLFEDPEFGYFASDKVDDRVYWFLSNDQIKVLEDIDQKRPTYGSLAFEDTGYYIMREGWGKNDKMMIISAGLDEDKPDHQHGDMLGIQAMANGYAILPNYQVRYSLKDFDLFKNSMVKNVALVDDELQGKEWTSNKGGSGFGKFKKLPQPEVLAWEVNDDFDLFVGKHNGFEESGVQYSRQVIFVKDEFWIVKDNFNSSEKHNYKQVWQGHYTDENGPNLLRATTAKAYGHDLLQLIDVDSTWRSGARGKQWSVVSKEQQERFSFITIIYPYREYDSRLNEEAKRIRINDWVINHSDWKLSGEYAQSLSTEDGTFLFNTRKAETEYISIESPEEIDLFIKVLDKQVLISSLASQTQSITVNLKDKERKKSYLLKPGALWRLNLQQ